MNGKKFLIFLDILGFEVLADGIASASKIDTRKVRHDFVDTINEKIESLAKSGEILGKRFGGGDDWLLVTEDPSALFLIVSRLLDHNTGYHECGKVPLEIAVGTAEFDKWARFDGRDLLTEDETIEFLKTRIIQYYHQWYKTNRGASVTSTYLLFTQSAYSQLEPLDRAACREIQADDTTKRPTFFAVEYEKMDRRLKNAEFLSLVDLPARLYDHLDEVYVTPKEYTDILQTLKAHRIIFIVGSPEYGKTYTAVKLLWEFFLDGFYPIWQRGSESSQRSQVRENLENIDKELLPKRIIYFEDPFGQVKYEKRENLEREIGTIIDRVKQVQDAYVIITSREEVFKEFETEKLSQAGLEEFEKRLSIKKPSYDYKQRVEILTKWANKEGCKWLNNKRLTELISLAMQDETVLPTPLSIRDFVLSTVVLDSETQLTQVLKKKSKETALVFAREISGMSDDKVLFLSYAFISGSYDLRNLKGAYKNSARRLKMRYPSRFESLLDWFKDDKVTLGRKMRKGQLLGFSHPSYSEAFGHLIRVDQRVQRTITYAIQGLVRRGENKENVAHVIAFQFDRLIKNIRNKLLSELIADEEGAKAMATVVLSDYDELPYGKQMLFTLASDADYVLEDVLKWFVFSAFGYPGRILSQLAEDTSGMFVLSNLISTYFDEMPASLRDPLVLKMADDPRARNYIVRIIDARFDHAGSIGRLRNNMIRHPITENSLDTCGKAVDRLFDELPSADKNVLMLAFAKMRRALRTKGAVPPSHKSEWS